MELHHLREWADFMDKAMIISLVVAALAAAAVVVTTWLSIHFNGAVRTEENKAFDRYKVESDRRAAELEKEAATARERSAQLDLSVAGANERAAQANARAEQANLELQRLRFPRSINVDTLVADLAGKPTWPVIEILYVDETDSSSLAVSIAVAVSKAGWGNPIPRVMRGPNPNWEYGARVADTAPTALTWGAQSNGVSVVSSSEPDPDGRNPAITLWTAISSAISEGQTNLGRDSSLPPDMIRLVVAPRR